MFNVQVCLWRGIWHPQWWDRSGLLESYLLHSWRGISRCWFHITLEDTYQPCVHCVLIRPLIMSVRAVWSQKSDHTWLSIMDNISCMCPSHPYPHLQSVWGKCARPTWLVRKWWTRKESSQRTPPTMDQSPTRSHAIWFLMTTAFYYF